MRIALSALVLTCLSASDIAAQAEKRPTAPVENKTPPAVVTKRAAACESLDCTTGVSTTRWAVIPISDRAFLAPTPDPICACAGDTIEWMYANGSHTKDKDVYIQDAVPFLDQGECKKSLRVKKDTLEKVRCRVQPVMNGTYKYTIKGSHLLDPEVEVRGGMRPPPPPPPTPKPPTPKPSRRP